MSKLKTKNTLPSLQKLIVLHLAKSKPQTINQTAKKIKKSYRPTWSAFKSLEKKKLIWKADVKKYNQREFPSFWLTAEGIVAAMFEGADKTLLLEKSRDIFPKEEIIHLFIELIYINPKFTQLAFNIIKNKGTIELGDVILILYANATSEDVETMKKIVALLKKYPEMYKQYKKQIEKGINQFNQLIKE